jgi:hypothetical protein
MAMQETTRTLVFLGVAALSVALAGAMHWATRPVPLAEFSDVGEEFFPEFDDPTAATGLRVAAYNQDAARVDIFNIEKKDGLWRIPSHHNYPADGEERLAKSATSIIGIRRDALVSTSADDFRRLGVLDPLDEQITGTEGRGSRITLLQADTPLADYIVGTKIEGQEDVYHVRRPDESRTYRATLKLDLSTKFADWIKPGLLDVTRSDLREIVIDRYSIDESRGALVQGEVSELTRANATDSWKLAGLDEAKESLKTSEVNNIINAVEDLKIVGVRPKPPGLSADLKGEGETAIDTMAFLDLQSKGFFVDARGQLVSNEGEVRVGAADGVLYVLRFGEVFTGSDVEIEVGQSTPESAETPAADDQNSDAAAEGDSQAGDAPDDAATDSAATDDKGTDSASADGDESTAKRNRYLFVTAQFDESLLEPLREKPTPPPAASKTDGESTTDAQPTQPAEGEQAADPSDADKADAAKAQSQYEADLKAWEAEQKAHNEKIDSGKERVKNLNVRFADWYYVIAAEHFDSMRVDRSKLVEAKAETPAPDADAPPAAGTSATPPETAPAAANASTPPETPPSEPRSSETPAPESPSPEARGTAPPSTSSRDEPPLLPKTEPADLPQGEAKDAGPPQGT